jgi:4-hydroxybenzoate polyprenyltransferase
MRELFPLRLLVSLLKLSRWKEHLVFTLAATLAGANLALRDDHPDYHLLIVLIANSLAVTFVFMVNDIEDAPDDAFDAARGTRNAVTSGEISPRLGWWIAWFTAGLALITFASIHIRVLAVGALTVGLGWLYSWRGVRLKAWPLVDVVSHLLMLSVLLFLAGYLTYHSAPGPVYWVAAGVGLISAYGQLYNQLRDYADDRAAGLHNTACFLGRRYTQWVMYLCLAGAAACLIISVMIGMWPVWLAVVPAVALPLLFRRSTTDMRGSRAIDASGGFQSGSMSIAALTMIVWTIQKIIG